MRFAHAVDAREELLRVDRGIVGCPRRQAVVAVVAAFVRIRLAEVRQQLAPAAIVRVRIAFDALELRARGSLLARRLLLDEPLDARDVTVGEEQDRKST